MNLEKDPRIYVLGQKIPCAGRLRRQSVGTFGERPIRRHNRSMLCSVSREDFEHAISADLAWHEDCCQKTGSARIEGTLSSEQSCLFPRFFRGSVGSDKKRTTLLHQL